MVAAGVEEARHLVCLPRIDLLDFVRLGDGAGESDAGGRIAGKQSFVDGFGKRSAQDGLTDVHAAPGEPAVAGQGLDPLGDIVAVEAGDGDRSEATLDVGVSPTRNSPAT